MEAIKETITSVMQELKEKKAIIGDFKPNELLKKVFSKKELKHIKYNYFKKGILNLNVESSSWLYSVTLRKQEILAKLKKEFRAINDIHFRIGEMN